MKEIKYGFFLYDDNGKETKLEMTIEEIKTLHKTLTEFLGGHNIEE